MNFTAIFKLLNFSETPGVLQELRLESTIRYTVFSICPTSVQIVFEKHSVLAGI
jgi:hypothetical protein